MRGLEGKIAIVAGAATGIGAATAVRLVEEGARVVVGDINKDGAEATAARARSKGGEAVAVQFDVSDEASVKDLIQKTVDQYGDVDVMHVNAAAMHLVLQDTDVINVPLELFDTTIKVNMRGHFLCARHVLPHMLKKKRGALVFTSSEAAFGFAPENPCYSMSKAGINALVRHIAMQYGRDGIRANAIAPGVVITEEVRPNLSADLIATLQAPVRGPRVGASEDIAAMVAMLLSDDSAYVNGQTISVNGGSTLR
jgi:NAD(P)-dependent dehydrogenase (short-subunit alcohol dehydrogenase family)